MPSLTAVWRQHRQTGPSCVYRMVVKPAKLDVPEEGGGLI